MANESIIKIVVQADPNAPQPQQPQAGTQQPTPQTSPGTQQPPAAQNQPGPSPAPAPTPTQQPAAQQEEQPSEEEKRQPQSISKFIATAIRGQVTRYIRRLTGYFTGEQALSRIITGSDVFQNAIGGLGGGIAKLAGAVKPGSEDQANQIVQEVKDLLSNVKKKVHDVNPNAPSTAGPRPQPKQAVTKPSAAGPNQPSGSGGPTSPLPAAGGPQPAQAGPAGGPSPVTAAGGGGNINPSSAAAVAGMEEAGTGAAVGGALAAAGAIGLVILAAEKAIEGLIGAIKATANTMAGFITKTSSVGDVLASSFEKIPILSGLFGVLAQTASATIRALETLSGAFIARARELEQYSGAISVASANREISSMNADIKEANKLGPDLAKLIEAQTRMDRVMDDALLPIKQIFLEKLVPIIEKLSEMLEKFMDTAGPALEQIGGTIMDLIGSVGLGVVQLALDTLKNILSSVAWISKTVFGEVERKRTERVEDDLLNQILEMQNERDTFGFPIGRPGQGPFRPVDMGAGFAGAGGGF